jgi:hypothetical protein
VSQAPAAPSLGLAVRKDGGGSFNCALSRVVRDADACGWMKRGG